MSAVRALRPTSSAKQLDTNETTRAQSPKRPLVIGALAAVLALAIFVVLSPKASPTGPALVAASAIPLGAPLTSADLRVVKVPSNSSLSVLSPNQLSQVVGKTAAVAIPPGAVINAGELTTNTASGTLVGLALKVGQFPPGLYVGEAVTLFASGSNSVSGRVTAIASGQNVTGATSIAVRVAPASAGALATAAAAGNVVVVAP